MTFYDVIIVGAGSIGTPTAMALANAGVKTLVVDKLPSVAQGDNKHAIGGIRATHSQKSKILVCQRSLEIFSTWEELYGDDIWWVEGGYSFVARSVEHERLLRETVEIQKEYGLNISFLDAEQIQELIPGINPIGLHGGTYSPEDGNASPLYSVHAFYDNATRNGAEFKFKEQVKNILTKNRHVVGVRTDKADYQASFVINAAGGNGKEIAKMVDVNVPLEPESHEAGITEGVKYFLRPMVVDIQPGTDPTFGNSKNYYFYQNKFGKIIFCITPNPSVKGKDRTETSFFLPQIAKRMVDLMPRLSNIKVRRQWRGLYPMTPDGIPIVGTVKNIAGYINAVGMCGQGFMLGPGLGEVLCRLVEKKITSQDKEILKEFSLYRDFGSEEKLK
ncbi:MAG: FAD-binding oxidoreductase [Candidatus Lokiarchaeota archaeon]|nr:FAD-binding oxidoreductase [Candidatus Lokiarchaeota archaeon]